MSNDLHALCGAYALDALDGAERDAFERHLATCSDCQVEVIGLREAAVSLADTVALAPPAALRDQVLANIAQVRPLPPVVTAARGRASRRIWMTGALLAAAVVALVLVWVQPGNGPAPRLSVAEQIVQASDVVSVHQQLPQGGTLVWYRSKKLNGAAVSLTDLPAAANGKTYELWLQSADGVMLPAGLTTGGTALVALQGEGAAAVGAGLTIEPAGGSEEPTLPPVTVAEFPGS